MDYRALIPNPNEVHILRHHIRFENWEMVKNWYERNTPWIDSIQISQFVVQHQKEVENFKLIYETELSKKKQQVDHTKQSNSVFGSVEITEQSVQDVANMLKKDEPQENIEQTNKKDEQIPGFG